MKLNLPPQQMALSRSRRHGSRALLYGSRALLEYGDEPEALTSSPAVITT